ncbi:hypothetical protein [Roseateles albus]|uniref:Lipoprotein n=1 Tax=Roseateles albus TaxID=2987525 RepID=A0ABT5KI26_9BURK|nr:hypothetical protein [Roseateles albus]MDC8773591.1 hypothetical protein [Roseateles albus]
MGVQMTEFQLTLKSVGIDEIVTSGGLTRLLSLRKLLLAGLGLSLALTLYGCGPSEQQKAEQRRIDCLNKPCEGDVVPKVSAGNVAMKVGGRYFSVPKAYRLDFLGLAFYWPSKTHLTGPPEGGSFPEKGQPFYDIAIELDFVPEPASIELSDMIAMAEKKGRPVTLISQSTNLDVVTVQLREQPTELSTIYVAKNASYPSGKPAAMGCTHARKDDRCSAYFAWGQGMHISVSFNQRHAQDWPQIYAEIERVLALVKPL